MAFKRTVSPMRIPEGDRLAGMLAGIGCALAVDPIRDAHIEDALVGAVQAGMEGDDLRSLGLAVQWIGLHGRVVNVDRLTRVAAHLPERSRACWAAVATWMAPDPRWRRLARMGVPTDLLLVGNAFQVGRRGEDARFAGSCLRVPAGVLREREGDVLTAEALARVHLGYRYRLLIGPTYRADMWAALARSPGLSPSALARCTYGAFATAWQVVRDAPLVGGGLPGAPGQPG